MNVYMCGVSRHTSLLRVSQSYRVCMLYHTRYIVYQIVYTGIHTRKLSAKYMILTVVDRINKERASMKREPVPMAL